MTRHTDKQPAHDKTARDILAGDPAAAAMFVSWTNGEPVACIVTVHDDVPGHVVTPIARAGTDAA